MKKILSLLLLLTFLCACLSACGKPQIEDYEWKMRTVMHIDGSRLIVDAVSEADPARPEAKVIEMTLTAKDGKLTLTDHTNEKTYEGTYTLTQKTPEGADYTVTLDGKSGYATVAMTTYADGKESPTLPINLEGYALYFYAE